MIIRVNVCMCEFLCVCWIVFPPESSTSLEITWFFYPKSLCFGEPKTRKSRSFFSKRLITQNFVRIYGPVKKSSLQSKFRVCFDDDESEENFLVFLRACGLI
jgi:hypothetical protein